MAELWNAFKRVVLVECGLYVVLTPSRRIYFAEPHSRPKGPHSATKLGHWREPVTAPSAYERTADDDEDDKDKVRGRTYVRSAAYEQSMGAGGVRE